MRTPSFTKDYPDGTRVASAPASLAHTEATATDEVFVLVGDAQRARLVTPGKTDTLQVLWEAYPATPDVHPLGQAQDINRHSPDAVPPPAAETQRQFARDVGDRMRTLASEHPRMRLVVIAPPSFAGTLQSDLGALWPSRAGDVIRRDETKLDDEVLRTVITARLSAP